MAGLTGQGFEPKPLEDIKADLGSALRTVFGMAITLIAQSVFGQLIGVVADRLADLWQLGLNIYTASTREGAVGVQLDHIGLLTGTARRAATNTKVMVTCLGDNGTVITEGSVVSIPSVGTRFFNPDPGTISSGTVTIEFEAVDTGPLAAPAGTLTQIDTPLAGWNSSSNALDEFTLGTDIETDAAYRVRQVSELRGQGDNTTAAIRAKVGALENVSGVFVFENDHDLTDVNNVPPHSFEVVVVGGDDAEIAQVIADEKPTGIGTYGSTTESATDANGFSVDISFSRAATLNIYVICNITVDSSKFPDNGAALIKSALVAFEDNYHLGSEVRSSALIPSIFAATAGVLECGLPLIGTSASPTTSTTITVNNRQIADLDTSRMTINVTPINP